jgi:hypothetical protein
MERTFRVSETVLSCSELTEILRRARHHVIEQAKDDSPSRFRVDRDIELYGETWGYHQKFPEGMQLKHYGAHEYKGVPGCEIKNGGRFFWKRLEGLN